jgi:methylenetetrahydrofolate dehydrogenase (NADP+)/methenyltetrahydrofolate cyclohydrolase
MIIDGKALSQKRITELRTIRDTFGPLTLALVVSTDDAVTSSFIRIKKRIAAELNITVVDCASLAEVGDADGVILQLPLPAGMDADVERNKIPFTKDVDVLSDAAFDAFVAGTYPPPPVPRAMAYILNEYHIDPKGKKVVVVGQGRLVGKPAAELFNQLGAHVVIATRGNVEAETKDADIIILGAGDPHFLKPEMIKEGVVILDAGTSESSGKVVGDADPSCADKASLMTPVPRGVGPLAVVEIFANLLQLKQIDLKA